MTSTEDVVRDALADLAPIAPADSSAYAGVGRRITRRRRQRAATRLAAVAVVALVAVAGASLVGRDDEPSGFSTGEGRTITTGPDAGPDDGAPPGPGTGQDGIEDRDDGAGTAPTPTTLGPATFTLPAGWEAVQQDEAWIEVDGSGGSEVPHPYTSMCLRRTADPGPLDCTLEMFHGDVPGHEGFEAYDPNGKWSWYRAGDPMSCPDGADPGGEALDTVQPVDGSMAPVDSDFPPVGSRTAAHSRWSAVCERSGFEFSPEAWFLPESELLIIEVLDQPETEAILDSFTFVDDGG
jgi:hypothetical protein